MYTVLFLGFENSRRSQMAEGFVRHLAPTNKIKVISAGIKPNIEIDPLAVDVMREKNIEITDQKPKDFHVEMLIDVSKTITLGQDVRQECSEALVWKDIDDWDLDSPSGGDITSYRKIRDKIEKKVKNLLRNINIKYSDELIAHSS